MDELTKQWRSVAYTAGLQLEEARARIKELEAKVEELEGDLEAAKWERLDF